ADPGLDHTGRTGIVLEDVAAHAATEIDRALHAAVGDGFVEVRASHRRAQVEGRNLGDRRADVVVDVLAEVADRQVAALAVVPLEGQIEVLRLQRLQAAIALRTGAAFV